MKYCVLTASLLVILCKVSAQNLIGYKESEIRKYMKENRKELSFNRVVNSKFMYLKYSDSSDSNTTLFFLGPDSVCRSIRIICDEKAKYQKVKEFNTIYRKRDANSWTDTKNGKNYLIEMIDDKWSTTITFSQVNK
jgi:hypothetical protein